MNYHNIIHDDIRNGDGVRVTLFVSGCLHRCKGCHNPQTWGLRGGVAFNTDAINEIEEELDKDHIAGLTVSGGDPLHWENQQTVLELLREVKYLYPNKNVWLYTGYTWEMVRHLPIMKYIDVLVDGKFMEEFADVNYQWAGSTNQRVIDVYRSRESGKVVPYVSV